MVPHTPLAEAVFSLTLKGRLGGHEALLTARGGSWQEFKENLEHLRGLLDAPVQPQPASQRQPRAGGSPAAAGGLVPGAPGADAAPVQ